MSSEVTAGTGVVCAIPARYGSTRLPGKPLRTLAGRTMIEHVYRKAEAADGVARVVVLTDDLRIQKAVEDFGGHCEMTPADCPSGTDRIAFAAKSWNDESIIINVQGDEPLIDPHEISMLARHMIDNPEERMATLATRVDASELNDPNRVKVVFDSSGRALYFSRAAIPHQRNDIGEPIWRHVGIYAYRKATLLTLAKLEPTPLERSEGLEQLRALENGIAIRVLEAKEAPIGVDTQADFEAMEQLLNEELAKSTRNRGRESKEAVSTLGSPA